MRKALISLLLGLIVFAPMSVFALKVSPLVDQEATEVKEGDKLKRTYKVYRVADDFEAEEETIVTEAAFNFTFGKAIEVAECSGSDSFDVTQDTTATTGTVICTWNAKDAEAGVKGEKILLGTITITLDANTTEDCTINYSYEGESGKINPATGGSLPYAIIAAGVLLAGGVYVATRKKNKLYNI